MNKTKVHCGRIQKATIKDISDIVETNKQLIPSWLSEKSCIYCQKEWIEKHIKRGGFYKLGKSFICLETEPDCWGKDSNKLRIITLAIEDKLHRKGIGKKLVKFAINQTKKRKKKSLIVSSYYSFNAKDFYLKCGFKLIDDFFDNNYRFEMNVESQS